MKKDDIITKRLEESIQERLDEISRLKGAERTEAIEQLQKLNQTLNERLEGLKIKPWETSARFVLDGFAVIVPMALTAIFIAAGFEFEKTGTFTSKTLGFVTKFLRLK